MKCCGGGGAAQWSSSAGAQVLQNLDKFSCCVALCSPYFMRSSAVAEQWHFWWLGSVLLHHHHSIDSELQHSTTKPMRMQSFKGSYSSVLLPVTSTDSNRKCNHEVGFHQHDLTSVTVCSSPHHTMTPHYVLVTEALAQTRQLWSGICLSSEMSLFLQLQNSQCVCIFSLSLPFRTVSISC